MCKKKKNPSLSEGIKKKKKDSPISAHCGYVFIEGIPGYALYKAFMFIKYTQFLI